MASQVTVVCYRLAFFKEKKGESVSQQVIVLFVVLFFYQKLLFHICELIVRSQGGGKGGRSAEGRHVLENILFYWKRRRFQIIVTHLLHIRTPLRGSYSPPMHTVASKKTLPKSKDLL